MVETSLVETSPRVDTAGMGQARRPQDSHFKDQKCFWAYHDCELQFPSFCRPARGPGLGCFDNPLFSRAGKGGGNLERAVLPPLPSPSVQLAAWMRFETTLQSNAMPSPILRRFHKTKRMPNRSRRESRVRGWRRVVAPAYLSIRLPPFHPAPTLVKHYAPLTVSFWTASTKLSGPRESGQTHLCHSPSPSVCELIPQRESAHVTRRRARKQNKHLGLVASAGSRTPNLDFPPQIDSELSLIGPRRSSLTLGLWYDGGIAVHFHDKSATGTVCVMCNKIKVHSDFERTQKKVTKR